MRVTVWLVAPFVPQTESLVGVQLRVVEGFVPEQ